MHHSDSHTAMLCRCAQHTLSVRMHRRPKAAPVHACTAASVDCSDLRDCAMSMQKCTHAAAATNLRDAAAAAALTVCKPTQQHDTADISLQEGKRSAHVPTRQSLLAVELPDRLVLSLPGVLTCSLCSATVTVDPGASSFEMVPRAATSAWLQTTTALLYFSAPPAAARAAGSVVMSALSGATP